MFTYSTTVRTKTKHTHSLTSPQPLSCLLPAVEKIIFHEKIVTDSDQIRIPPPPHQIYRYTKKQPYHQKNWKEYMKQPILFLQ